MSETPAGMTLRGIALEALGWSLMPALFLLAYVGRFEMPASAVVPHLRLVGAALVALFVLRAGLYLVLPGARWYRAVATPVLGLFAMLMLLYYALVLVGLNSWSRVISWDLIRTYATQAGDLAQTLELSLAAVTLGAAALFAVVCAALWWYLARFDWIGPAVGQARRSMLAVCMAAGAVLVWLESTHFVYGQLGMLSEPVSMTVFPGSTTSRIANTSSSSVHQKAMDTLHNQARAQYRPNPSARKRNVILIVVDALRAANMGVYGYMRDTTPFLQGAYEQGKLTRQPGLRSTCAESACGILSISSSMFLHDLSPNPFTLHQVLKLHGYGVHLILGGDHTNFYGLRQLYGDVDSYYDGFSAKGYFSNDDTLVTARVDALPKWDKQPTLFHMHLMSVHGLGKRLEPRGPFQPARSYIKHPNAYTSAAGSVRDESRNYYDNGVRQADQVIGTLLASLGRKGYLDDALVIVTADHGESLGEHGLYVHANSVHEPLLKVPFLVLSYGSAPPTLREGEVNASQVDIAPTILAELDMPAPATWSGVALQSGNAIPFTYFEQGKERGLIDARRAGQVWKYWRHEVSGAEFAFDLSHDTNELHNRIDAVSNEQKKTWRHRLLNPQGRH